MPLEHPWCIAEDGTDYNFKVKYKGDSPLSAGFNKINISKNFISTEKFFGNYSCLKSAKEFYMHILKLSFYPYISTTDWSIFSNGTVRFNKGNLSD